MRIGSKWVDKVSLKEDTFQGVEILSETHLRWWGIKMGTMTYYEPAIRSNFIEIPQELENESEEVIKLYFAL